MNYEMFFYLIFGAGLLVSSARQVFAVASFLTMLVVAGLLLPVSGISEFYTKTILLEFVFGMVIAKSGKSISPFFVPLGFVLMPILYATVDVRLISLGVPAMLIVWGLVSFEHKIANIPILSLIGDASYSIYLFHMLVFSSIYHVWTTHEEVTVWFIPVGILAAVAVGISIHISIETPITTYLAAKLKWMGEKRGSSSERAGYQRQT
ncbi:acyltransferase [Parasphingorhabdus cellanae]|uniref:Acyltransferase n=1 Tax=Parasphingorhabdus cellanae TaxID=2806553 RepID=A0ABX7T7M1_9SPHN|nr:acyltransferase [Parasphingorhabdus cellanae]QTD56782.1 acyltransferase [Parasphingorhabdus cellanae]